MLVSRMFVTGLLVLAIRVDASAQEPAVPLDGDEAVAFINVNLIRMDRERVETGQSVLTRGDRIVAIGPRAAVRIPAAATLIEGEGRYLLPGLTDAHVHLEGDGTGRGKARSDFGDAPLYLAYGVTTVVNLRGTPVQLDWKRRIESGELIGPTIYTAGEFVNEPRVNSPDEVRGEILAQASAGYDLIKFHEIFTPESGNVTRRGLSLPAYVEMNETAREIGIPLVGHAPVNLGLEATLRARQSLAHIGTLANLYFLPVTSNLPWVLVTVGALLALMVIVATWAAAVIVGRWRGASPPRQASRFHGHTLAGCLLVAGVAAAVCAALFLPGGPLFESLALRLAFTFLTALIAVGAVASVLLTIRVWRDTRMPGRARLQAVLVSVEALGLVGPLVLFWLPIAWRSSDNGIDGLATRIHNAGVWVQTTMVAYDAIGGPGRLVLVNDPAMDYLQADVQARWRRMPEGGLPGYRYTDFAKKVAGALHRAGVPLMAGTDAIGFPLITPGASLHRELQLLVESGLTPYEALRAATVTPATFLNKDEEFGTIAVDKRADLLLLERNPLESLDHLRTPVGVMTRGKWFSRRELQTMLDALRPE